MRVYHPLEAECRGKLIWIAQRKQKERKKKNGGKGVSEMKKIADDKRYGSRCIEAVRTV